MRSSVNSKAFQAVACMLQLKPNQPILLALSGGPDSLLLLDLLLEYQKRSPLTFAVAHVDHGWRKESADEAKILEDLVLSKKIPFHGMQLCIKNCKGNLESFCREERLQFFRTLSQKWGYVATLLGHHADDRAETTLKRLFEGASLFQMHGMRQIQVLDGLEVWRPLLFLTKKEILQEGKKRGLLPFIDPTNQDERFLRSRMRKRLIPQLSETFGKEVSSRLCAFAEESLELQEFLETLSAPFLKKRNEGVMGVWYDLKEVPSSDFQLKYLIKKILEKEGEFLSKESIALAAVWLRGQVSNKTLQSKKTRVFVDRGYLFFLQQAFTFLDWELHYKTGEKNTNACWKQLFSGQMTLSLPLRDYKIVSPREGASFRSLWNEKKVPAFLREAVPLLCDEKGNLYELLSGKTFKDCEEEEEQVNLTIRLKLDFVHF